MPNSIYTITTMAIFFPALPTARKKMQPGERRFADRLESHLEDDQATGVRLLYIAMTRAMQNLLITSCKSGYFSEQLVAVEAQLLGVG